MAEGTAVVVGTGPGLGLALVEAFAHENLTVFAAARSATSLALPPDVSERCVAVDCDATKPEDVKTLFERAEARGPLQVAVYNAGVYRRSAVLDLEPDEFEHAWRVGCYGGFLVGRAAARAMITRGAGTILFTGATASLRGGAGFVALASPKFGLRALAQSLARELSPKGIHVAHVIVDGQIASDRYAHLAAERGPDSLLEPRAIADAYVMLHHQHRSAWTHELDLRPWVEKF